MAGKGGEAGRFLALDGLRGVFALAIVLFHLRFATHFFGWPGLRDAYLAVDFFFVLSGFVIAHAYWDRLADGASTARFLIRRVGRIWPLHVAVLLALVVLEVVRAGLGDTAFDGETSGVALAANLVLVQAWGPLPIATWNVPAWSISAELFAYILFAVVSLLAPTQRVLLSALIAVISAVVLMVFAPDMDQAATLALPRVGYGFFAGVLVLAAWRHSGGLPGLSPRLASGLELALVVVTLGYIAMVQRGVLGFAAPLLFAVAIYVFAAGRGVVSRLLSSRPLQFLGRVSFSVYLLHFLINAGIGMAAALAERITGMQLRAEASAIYGVALPPERANWLLVDLGGPWVNDVASIAYVAALLALSALSWRFIEQPGQKLFGRLAQRVGQPRGEAVLPRTVS